MHSAANLFPSHLEVALKKFSEKLISQLEQAGFIEDIGQIDHACYRVSDLKSYESYKRTFADCGQLLSEAYINGRPIATYKLHQSIALDARFKIDVIELPAPKPGLDYEEGFEHIEVVTPLSLETLVVKHPNYKFHTGNMHAKINRDISLKFDGGVVKFNESSLEDVIIQEKIELSKRTTNWLLAIDFDDTITDSKLPFLKATHLALEEFLGRPINFETVRSSAEPTFPAFFAHFGIHDPTSVDKVIQLFQKHWPSFAKDCQVYEGIDSLLSCLQSEGVKIHVWTARDLITTTQFLVEHRLSSLVESIHAFDGRSKPEPPTSLKDASQSSRCILLGDSVSDVTGAQNLGAYFLQAAWVHQKDLNVNVDVICKTPLEALSKMLKKYQSPSPKKLLTGMEVNIFKRDLTTSMEAIEDFYKSCGYPGSVDDTDQIILATTGSRVIGAIRLVEEEGTHLLRGMYIAEQYQRMGIGALMLKQFEELIVHQKITSIYLTCGAHLNDFYGKIGFKIVTNPHAIPSFLSVRSAGYAKKFGPQLIMQRKKL